MELFIIEESKKERKFSNCVSSLSLWFSLELAYLGGFATNWCMEGTNLLLLRLLKGGQGNFFFFFFDLMMMAHGTTNEWKYCICWEGQWKELIR
jgi:hypothetical protein